MNKTNTSDIMRDMSQRIELISDIMAYYCISAVSLIGLFINLYMNNLLRSKTLKFSFYKHIRFKTIIDSLICLLGVGCFNYVCLGCQMFASYEKIFYQLVITFSVRIMFMISSFHEIYLITNRYLILKNSKNCIVRLRFIYYIPVLVLVTLCSFVPIYFIIEIKPINEESELFYYKFDLNLNKYFMLYTLFRFFIENIFPFVALTILSVLCTSEYKKRLKIKSRSMIQTIHNLRKLENSYTRITIILTVLFILTRFSDFLIGVAYRLTLSRTENKLILSIVTLIRQSAYILYFSLHSLNGLLYIQIDQNLKALAKGQFSKIKVYFLSIK